MNESEVMKLEGMEAPSGIAFHQGKLVYFADNRVYEVDEAGNRLVKAYIPVQYAMVNTRAACSEAGVSERYFEGWRINPDCIDADGQRIAGYAG